MDTSGNILASMPDVGAATFVTSKKNGFKVKRKLKNNILTISPKSKAAEKLPQISPKPNYDTRLRTMNSPDPPIPSVISPKNKKVPRRRKMLSV